jgi:hypothetical protein
VSGTYPAQGEKNLSVIIQAIQDLYAGRNNAFGEFTLDVAPATTTVVRSPNSGPQSIPLLTPLTANAAAAVGAGTVYISDRGAGEFTVTHSSSAQNDRTFGYFTAG